MNCIICNEDNWLTLPNPVADQSVTTSGVKVHESLGKSQCVKCGLVQRTEHTFLGLTDFYEKQYTSYYTRPGQKVFNQSRYEELASWVADSLGAFAPESILEIGCGCGWTMKEMMKKYPNAKFKGVEPSTVNSQTAREVGLDVDTAKMSTDHKMNEKYDLVFSNHVLQHTTDPIDFLKACKNVVSDNGLIIITIQDASVPHNEILFSDQNFSFLPEHLVLLGEMAGLKTVSWRKAPDTDSLFLSQLVIYSKSEIDDSKYLLKSNLNTVSVSDNLNSSFLNQLFANRQEYITGWKMIEEFLIWKTNKNVRVYNFGAGLYSYLLECYCPKFWSKVEACTIDNVEGSFIDKRLISFNKLALSDNDCIVLGTRPFIQRVIKEKLQTKCEVISWDNFVNG